MIGFLMSQPQTPEVKAAAQAGIAWFKSSNVRVANTAYVSRPSSNTDDNYNPIQARAGSTMWYRFYDLDQDVGFFSGRLPRTIRRAPGSNTTSWTSSPSAATATSGAAATAPTCSRTPIASATSSRRQTAFVILSRMSNASKWAAALLLCSFSLAFVACGDSSSGNDAGSSGAAGSTGRWHGDRRRRRNARHRRPWRRRGGRGGGLAARARPAARAPTARCASPVCGRTAPARSRCVWRTRACNTIWQCATACTMTLNQCIAMNTGAGRSVLALPRRRARTRTAPRTAARIELTFFTMRTLSLVAVVLLAASACGGRSNGGARRGGWWRRRERRGGRGRRCGGCGRRRPAAPKAGRARGRRQRRCRGGRGRRWHRRQRGGWDRRCRGRRCRRKRRRRRGAVARPLVAAAGPAPAASSTPAPTRRGARSCRRPAPRW